MGGIVAIGSCTKSTHPAIITIGRTHGAIRKQSSNRPCTETVDVYLKTGNRTFIAQGQFLD